VGGDVSVKLGTEKEPGTQITKWTTGIGFGTPLYFVTGLATKTPKGQSSGIIIIILLFIIIIDEIRGAYAPWAGGSRSLGIEQDPVVPCSRGP
jgi:hypothetical protein